MPDKDKSERLKYLKDELRKQKEKLCLHNECIKNLLASLDFNNKEIKYNQGWIKFHKDSILKHKKQIKEAENNSEKLDQIGKLSFHNEQIKNHHNLCISYHKKEISYALKWIELNKKALLECESQIKFLEDKIAKI